MLAVRRLELTAANGLRAADRTGASYRRIGYVADRCRLYSAEANGPLHVALADAPGYVCSEYWGEAHASGPRKRYPPRGSGSLSFGDDTIDVVLTSDVLEHVADAYRAHGEIFRVLRPGGRHIFTVPFAGTDKDDVRALRAEGPIEYLAEPLYHGDPVRPGRAFLSGASSAPRCSPGFKRSVSPPRGMRLREPRHGIIGGDALVFVARKP